MTTTDTAPDVTGLINLLNALAIDFECDDNIYAKETCDKAAAALRTLLESNAALERERDELLEELGRVIMACPMSPEMRTRPADVGVKALRADRDRLKERVTELEKALEPFAREAKEWSPEANGGHAFDDAESIAGETSITVGHLRAARAALKMEGRDD